MAPVPGARHDAESNTDWWVAKLDANVARDRDTDRRLADAGWTVIRAWEHEDPAEVADRVEHVVRGGGRTRS
ncbi:hypothetical protein GCM10027601_11030 [Nocardioides ungokensis]